MKRSAPSFDDFNFSSESYHFARGLTRLDYFPLAMESSAIVYELYIYLQALLIHR